MNETLQKLRELAQESVLTTQDSVLKDQQALLTRARMAAPLIRAFKDVEKEFVRISILQQIWPQDYDRRDDRVSGLLVAFLGPERSPHGIKLAVPHGFLQFEVDIKPDGAPVFTCVRDTHGQRPTLMDFPDGARWLDFFYKSVADLVEL